MPTYLFRNIETREEFEQFLFISEIDKFLFDNPHLEQGVNGAPSIGDPIKLGFTKPPEAFREILRNAKGKHKGSTINSF